MLEILMSDYIILYLFLVLLSLFFYLIKQENLFILISMISLIAITGLRPLSVGADTLSYQRIFLFPEAYVSEIESGYLYLVNLAKYFNLDYQSFLILNSAIIFLGFGFFIIFQTKYKIASFFIFFSMFFLPSMNLLRQWMSMAFGIHVFNKRRFLFLDFLLVIISSSFHFSGLIFLFILITKYFSKTISFLSILLSSVFLFLLLSPIFIDLIKDYLPSSFLRYLTDPYFLGNGTLSIKTLIYLALFFAYFYVLRFHKLSVKEILVKNYLILALISASILSFVFSFSGQNYYMLHRFGYNLNLYFMLIIPIILSTFVKKDLYIILSTIILMFAMLIVNLISDNNRVQNYEFLINFII